MAKLTPGLVSVTLDALAPSRVIHLAVEAGLEAIEWSARRHVPHGDTAEAARVGERTRHAGLSLGNYGSYLRLGEPDADAAAIRQVIETAHQLGAPGVRVWAGARPSAHASPAYRSGVTDGLDACTERAAERGLDVVIEYHADTLTDDPASALELVQASRASNVRLGWQPPNADAFAGRLASLDAVAAVSADVHVFHWSLDGRGEVVRHALSQGTEDWVRYFARIRSLPADRRVLLEFVPGDDPALLQREAHVLRDLLAGSDAPLKEAP
ncbi:MAG: TIM barrel protein [Planctomycetota bacterium]